MINRAVPKSLKSRIQLDRQNVFRIFRRLTCEAHHAIKFVVRFAASCAVPLCHTSFFFAYSKRVELPRSFSQKVDVDTTINCFSLFFWCQMRSARMSYVLGSAESLGAAKNGVRLSLKTRSSRNVSISIRGDVPSSHMREGISSKFVIVRSWTLLQCLSVCR